MENIRVRFAPSPTGYLHVGGLRTALYNYLFAKKNNGKFILRIEDTDQTRLVEGAVDNLIQSLKWAGLDFDEGPGKEGDFGPYTQSQRLEMYKKHADELVEKGFAYYCFCSSERLDELREKQRAEKLPIKYDKHCLSLSKEEIQKRIDEGESYVIRLNIPEEGKIEFKDLVRKKIKIDFSQVDDQVLIKSDGFPTYHLANVVDDHYMQISHVIRGEEWLSSVPKHLYLYRAFGWIPPKFAHLPLLLNTDKSKLSKRQADVATEDYKKNGYLPEALVNFVALLGWNAGDNKELFTMQELIDAFDIKRVSKAGAVFDLTKLNWMNAQYLHNYDTKLLAESSKKFFVQENIDINNEDKYLQAVEIAKNYASKLSEIVEFAKPLYCPLNLTEEDFALLNEEDALKVRFELAKQLKNIKTDEELDGVVKVVQTETGVKGKKLFFPLRLALYGKTSGPHVPALVKVLGIEESIKRLEIKGE